MGGALYLYLRGIDQAGQGVYFSRPPFELIHALDLAFQGHAIEMLSEAQS
jgi:exodeoxyribonuclease V beta subunit